MTNIRISEKAWMSFQHELRDTKQENEQLRHDLDRQMTIANEHLNEAEATKQELSDYKQEVSDAVVAHKQAYGIEEREVTYARLSRFIITKPKPDPLVEATLQVFPNNPFAKEHSDRIRAALDALLALR